MGQKYLRGSEVADRLHVTNKTVARWAKEGKLPSVRTLGGHRRYDPALIDRLAESLEGEAARERAEAGQG